MWVLIQRLLMLMLWMWRLSLAQEEKDELGLLLGAEFIPRAPITSNQNLSVSSTYSVDYARCLIQRKNRPPPGAPVRCRRSHRVESAQLTPLPISQHYL